MKHLLRSTLALLAPLLIAMPAAAADLFVNVLTGGTSGVYYPLGVALANNIGKALPAAKTASMASTSSSAVKGLRSTANSRAPCSA